MKKKWKSFLAKCLILVMLIFLGKSIIMVHAAAPGDETYDDDAGYSCAVTQFTVDGIKYTLTGPGPDTLVTNVAPSGWGELGDGGSDNYISIMGIDTLKIEAADGSYFKLNGFEMGFCSVAGVTITPSTGSSITRARVGDQSYYSVDVSGNSDFEYINSFTISGTDMIMNLDDLDFSPAVPPTYTLTYYGNDNTGGSAPTDGASPYVEGDTVTVLGNTGSLTKTGYTFAGWNSAANGSGMEYAPASTFAMGGSNTTLYAQWTPVDYTVTYDDNTSTGGVAPTDSNVYHITGTVSILGNTGTLVKTGYTFAGWNTAANGSGTGYSPGNTFAMGSANVTLYAQWTENTYQVTYNGNSNTGGTIPTDATTYYNGDTATVLGNTGTLTRTGYTFAEWNTAANGSGTGYSPSDTFSIGLSNVTLYAQWTPIDYAVTYNGNTNTGGAVPTDGNTYHITDTVSVLGNSGTLVKTGYTFAGWNTAANGSGTGYGPGSTFAMGSANVTLYAQWTENTYQVTYNGNSNTGGTIPTDATAYHNGDTATALGNTGTLTRTGYTFAGWNTAANGSGTGYSPVDTFSIGLSNVTLYAQWTPIDYTVTYNGNTNTGGAVPTDGNTYHIIDTVSILGNLGTLVKTGYTFAGWNTAANGSGTNYAPGSTFAMGSANVTLYAQWVEIEYNVTYNGNGNSTGVEPTDSNKYHIAGIATVCENTGGLSRTGYTFSGWNTAANGSGISYTGGNTLVIGSADVILYAQWTANNYSVIYDGNTNMGGVVPFDGAIYHITDTVTVAGNTGSLTKAGYTFTGWNTAANGSGANRTPGQVFAMNAENVTLYAQWNENTYKITYNGNSNTNGSVPVDGTDYHIGNTVTVLDNSGSMQKTGYTFTGWNTAANGSGVAYSAGDSLNMGTNNVTLYAQWTANNYRVTFDGNGNTGGITPVDTNIYHFMDTITVPGNTGNLVKTGYVFDGWNTAASYTGSNYAAGGTFTMGSNDVKLYAKWVYLAGNSGGNSLAPSQSTVTIIVNGEKQDAGITTTTFDQGKEIVTVSVNNEMVIDKIDETIQDNTANMDRVLQVPVTDKNAEVAKVELTGDIVKKLEDNAFSVSVKRDNVEYIISAEEFSIDNVAKNLGVAKQDLQDIKIEVKITKVEREVIEKYKEIAETSGMELIVPPVSFEIVAQTIQADGTTQEQSISTFNHYVTRIMAIPVGVDASKITTGIVFNQDGTYNHVPTEVFEEDGKWYAKINSLTNSEYAVISNPVTVKSVEKHWSKNAVNDLASRLVIFNPATFTPDAYITRADFAEYMVRALGLYKTGSTHVNKFKDVKATGERTLGILIASEYGIVTGYADGTFRPNALITREEAMIMYSRAMKVTKLTGSDTKEYQKYADFSKVSTKAKRSVKEVLAAHVFTGSKNKTISPKSNLTYAVAAQAIENLLVESKLINK